MSYLLGRAGDGQHQQGEDQRNKRGAGDAGGDGGGDQNNNPSPRKVCPRCFSFDTKFCYYNNYSLTQPRYFCKNCRRYWTYGGYQRNVPFGGGCRKSKRPRVSSSASSSSGMSQQPTLPMPLSQPHPLPVTAVSAGNRNMLFGRGNNVGFFMSSFAAIQQGVSQQSLTFGSGLGFFREFALPNFQPNPQDQLFQNMYNMREVGGPSSSSAAGGWNVTAQFGGPPLPPATNDNNNTSNNIRNNSLSNQWSGFMGNGGLDEA